MKMEHRICDVCGSNDYDKKVDWIVPYTNSGETFIIHRGKQKHLEGNDYCSKTCFFTAIENIL